MRIEWKKRSEPEFRVESRKSSAHVITTENDAVSLKSMEKYQLQKFKIPGLSVDPVVISQQDFKLKDLELIAHPFDMPPLMELCESNVTLGAIVRQIAVDAAGLGHTLPLKTDASENAAELKIVQDFLETPNTERTSLRYILNAMADDWGCLGNYALEVLWNAKDTVQEIRHLPVHNLWVHKDGNKYARLTKKGTTVNQRWYRRFGYENQVKQSNGTEAGAFTERASDVIYMHDYYRKSRHYGVPRNLTALGEILSLIGIRDYHLGFFKNHGVPAYYVKLTGEWDSEATIQAIKKHLTTGVLKGGNSYTTLVLELADNADIVFEPLQAKVGDTGNTFRIYKKSLQEDVLSAYSMPPYRIGIAEVGKLGGTNIIPATKIYKNAVISPLQMNLEDMINMVLRDGLGVESYRFDLNEMDASDAITPKDITDLIRSGAITPNEGRILLEQKTPTALAPYEGGDVFRIDDGMIDVGEVEPPTDGSGG